MEEENKTLDDSKTIIDEWDIAEEINHCDGCNGSCFLGQLIQMQRDGMITEEEMIEKLKEYYEE